MKIELIKQTFNNQRSYKYKPFSWCCEQLKNNPIIELCDNYVENYYDYDSDGCTPSVALRHTETIVSYEDEWEYDAYYKLNFCPFCGQKIDISVNDEEDISEIYDELNKKRKYLWKKYYRTDSKSKAEELRKSAQDLDAQIEWLCNLDEYEK